MRILNYLIGQGADDLYYELLDDKARLLSTDVLPCAGLDHINAAIGTLKKYNDIDMVAAISKNAPYKLPENSNIVWLNETSGGPFTIKGKVINVLVCGNGYIFIRDIKNHLAWVCFNDNSKQGNVDILRHRIEKLKP